MKEITTPAYVFDAGEFSRRIDAVKKAFPGIPLTYSVKAGPFLLPYLPDDTDGIEACSPGELSICIKEGIAPEKIIYSGVVKGKEDIKEALRYGAGVLTAESISQYELVRECVEDTGIRVVLLLRLSSGNQFGMSAEDLSYVIKDAESHTDILVRGVHYYSGTAKTVKKAEADIAKLKTALDALERGHGYRCPFVEYGPGLDSECFAVTNEECETKDMELLEKTASMIMELNRDYPLGIEMGRFLASSCGTYHTRVMDIKTTDDMNYLLVDGGTHHLKYHGQNMAMKTPVLEHDGEGEENEYTICGSLCTTADVLARNVKLRGVKTGDVIRFKRCGAYSVTESPVLFLSRGMPAVYANSEDGGISEIRPARDTFPLNKG